jgi:DNA repair protein RadA/Sms
VILIAHVTKDDTIAGPRTVEHAVDISAIYERGEDGHVLTIRKNRLGPVDPIPVPWGGRPGG